MKTRIVALACALCAAACGGSDDKTARDPSMARVTSTQETTTVTSAYPEANPEPTYGTATPGANAATPRGGSEPPKAAPNAGAQAPMNPPQATPAPQPPPAVANNPGAADQTPHADNTRVNERDRSSAALTPMDQGGSDAERQITAAIRRAVVGDKALSFTAKNVKIITTGTKVTLRGPVKSDQEKAVIEARAKQTAGVTEVDNQLEVKK